MHCGDRHWREVASAGETCGELPRQELPNRCFWPDTSYCYSNRSLAVATASLTSLASSNQAVSETEESGTAVWVLVVTILSHGTWGSSCTISAGEH